MIRGKLYNILDLSLVYRIVQLLAAPGSERRIKAELRSRLATLEAPTVDVGCGPRSWLDGIDADAIGVDLSQEYVRALVAAGRSGLVASATQLPFQSSSVQRIVSVGLFHHLSNPDATIAIEEMLRVVRPTGCIVIMDAILPSSRHQLIARLLRHFDRGEYVRSYQDHVDLFPKPNIVEDHRFTYSATGLEAVVTLLRGGPSEQAEDR